MSRRKKIFKPALYEVKIVKTDVDLDDNLSHATSTAKAIGNLTLAQTSTETFTTGYSSSASSTSVSAVD